MNSQLLSTKIFINFIWFILILSAFIYFWLVRRKTVLTKYWLKVEGRIIKCEWVICDYRLWPKIQYMYEVNHEDYIGEDFFLDKIHNDFNSKRLRNLAFKIASAYKNNINIDVFYNPKDPKQSVLDKKVPYKLNIILILLGLLLIIHIVSVISRFVF